MLRRLDGAWLLRLDAGEVHHNAVRVAKGEECLTLPTELAVGDAIGFVRKEMQEKGELGLKYTFSGSVFFNRMKARALYTTDVDAIKKRVEEAGMTGIFG